MEGILLIDKPKGKSSFYYVQRARKLFNQKKVGHAGTLDPFATGLLLLLVGRSATKRSDEWLLEDKEYVAVARLGEERDSYDEEGKLIESSSYTPSLTELEQAIAAFQGTVMQTPPMFSAKKINGKKLYTLARAGIEVKREPVPVTLTTTLLDYTYPFVRFHVVCSKGTYIRSIAHDLGLKLGTFAHLVELRRTRSGHFHLNQALDFQKFEESQLPASIFTEREGLFSIPATLLAMP
jgi:tRNA pseudouridine55 synthase